MIATQKPYSVMNGSSTTCPIKASAANTSETILSLQQVNIPAVLLAIYRITNTGVANSRGGSVVVQTDNGPFDLAPGASIDISTQTITIRSGDKPAHGTYQLLSNANVGNRGT